MKVAVAARSIDERYGFEDDLALGVLLRSRHEVFLEHLAGPVGQSHVPSAKRLDGWHLAGKERPQFPDQFGAQRQRVFFTVFRAGGPHGDYASVQVERSHRERAEFIPSQTCLDRHAIDQGPFVTGHAVSFGASDGCCQKPPKLIDLEGCPFVLQGRLDVQAFQMRDR